MNCNIPFLSLNDLPLELSTTQIREAFQPFIARRIEKSDDSQWREHLKRRRRRILTKGLRRLVTTWVPAGQRREDAVIREYSEAWGSADYDRYDIHKEQPRYSPWEWHEEKFLASTLGSTRFRQLMLIRLIEELKPRRVLEVGCGDGINLLLLACRFPEISFQGLELTTAGHERAKQLQQQAELPANMQKFAPLPLKDASGHRKVTFLQGSATDLPFEDNSQDLVFTILALEQMERIRHRVLSEIGRVTCSHAFMIEPFREVNSSGWRRLNVLRRDYFRAGVDDLLPHGLQPLWATDDFPQEVFLGSLAVLSRKNRS